MKAAIIVVCAIVLNSSARAQDQERYKSIVKEAWSLYEQNDFRGSAERYSAAFEVLGWKGTSNDRYNAACSYALAGNGDSAFFHLQRIAEMMDYANVRHITTDRDLKGLHTDERWEPLILMVRANKDRLEVNVDKPLAAFLDSILTTDQAGRVRIEEVEKEFGRGSAELNALFTEIVHTDSMNLIAITKLLDERGWLGADIVGSSGASAIFLVIQHAPLPTQERYLPMLREAVQKGNARGADLALLEDRILMRNGKRQIYGSQIGRDPDTGDLYLSPLEDPDHVDERRAQVGLGLIADYLMNWNLKWDAEAYKTALPALEERIRARKD